MEKWSAIKVLSCTELCWCVPWFVRYFYSSERKRQKLGSASQLVSVWTLGLIWWATLAYAHHPLAWCIFLALYMRIASVWLGLSLLVDSGRKLVFFFLLEWLDNKLQETQCNASEWMTLSNRTHIWWNLTNMFPVRKATLESQWLALWQHHLDAHRPKGKQRVRNDEGVSREWVIHFCVWASCPLQIIALTALKNGNCSAWHEML